MFLIPNWLQLAKQNHDEFLPSKCMEGHVKEIEYLQLKEVITGEKRKNEWRS